MRRAAVVFNPVAGSRGRAGHLASFRSELSRLGWTVDEHPTHRAGDAPHLAHDAAAGGADVVVAAGGDGTLNDVASGLRSLGAAAPPVAVLPLGTSNLLARELGHSGDPRAAARAVAAGALRTIDLADVTSPGGGPPRTLVACAGVGWDAHVVRELAARRRGHITFSTWLAPIFRALRDYPFPEFRVSGADGTAESAVLALFLNVRPYAAFFRPLPHARADDGMLDALLVRREAVRRLPAIAWRAWRGRPPAGDGVVVLRASSFRVEADSPVPCQVDGDVAGSTPVDMLVRPGCLRLVLPGPTAANGAPR